MRQTFHLLQRDVEDQEVTLMKTFTSDVLTDSMY